jgi:hypothetical protein
MAEGREAINFHQSNCKKPKIQPLDPSHYRPKSKDPQSPKCLHGVLFDQGNKCLKEIRVGHEWKPKVWSRGH